MIATILSLNGGLLTTILCIHNQYLVTINSQIKLSVCLSVPDHSFVTRDIFKRNFTKSSIISQSEYGAPPFSPTINRPPRFICMYNVKRFHAAV